MLFHTTKAIRVALGSSKSLGDTLVHHVHHDIKRSSAVVVVTDKGIIKTGLELPALESLKEEGFDVVVYDGVDANPPEQNVHDAVSLCKDVDAKAVIGLGGGSSLDVAKVTAFLAHPLQTQKLHDIYGVSMCKGPRLPLIQIPTTAGTGSEVTPISILTTGENEKKGIVSSQLLPDVALLDGDLTVGLPRDVTAMTGMDAMVHAIEAMTSKIKKNDLSDLFAGKALSLLGSNLMAVTGAEAGNGQVRENMLLGSMYAGIAFANAPVGAVHALAYPLGTHYKLPHGLSISMVAPPVFKFNAERSDLAESEYQKACAALWPGQEQMKSGELLADGFRSMAKGFGFSTRLGEIGVTEKDIPILVEDAMKQTRLLPNNPTEVTKEDCFALYHSIL